MHICSISTKLWLGSFTTFELPHNKLNTSEYAKFVGIFDGVT